jgi:hypothetical protein
MEKFSVHMLIWLLTQDLKVKSSVLKRQREGQLLNLTSKCISEVGGIPLEGVLNPYSIFTQLTISIPLCFFIGKGS